MISRSPAKTVFLRDRTPVLRRVRKRGRRLATLALRGRLNGSLALRAVDRLHLTVRLVKPRQRQDRGPEFPVGGGVVGVTGFGQHNVEIGVSMGQRQAIGRSARACRLHPQAPRHDRSRLEPRSSSKSPPSIAKCVSLRASGAPGACLRRRARRAAHFRPAAFAPRNWSSTRIASSKRASGLSWTTSRRPGEKVANKAGEFVINHCFIGIKGASE